LEPLPAAATTVRDFVFECLANDKKPATIRRYVSTIGRAHRASGILDPTSSEDVKLALKEMGRRAPARQKQVRGLTWAEIELFLSVEARNLRDIRDRALVAMAYDTMCRREELVSLLVEDIAEARLRQDVATDEVREATRSHAFESARPDQEGSTVLAV
jgi:integrase